MATPSVDATHRFYTQTRESLVRRAQKACTFFSDVKPSQVFLAQAWYEDVLKIQDQFTELADKIAGFNATLDEATQSKLVISQAKDDPEFHDVVMAVKAKYYSLQHQIQESQRQSLVAPQVANQTPIQANNTKHQLKRLEIPVFDGDIGQWKSFIGLYNSMVHTSTDYSTIEKFRHLQTLLSGEALSVISLYELEASNYQNAYQALIDRYENKRRLANYHVNQIVSFKFNSNNMQSSLKSFLQVHSTSRNALKNLNLSDLTDYLFFQYAYNNLDSHTKKEFDKSTYCKKPIPDFDNLIQFVQSLVQSDELETDLHPKSVTKAKSMVSTKSATELIKSTCTICKGEHKPNFCKTFLDASVQDRWQLIKKAKGCTNCLLGNHFNSTCRITSRCKVCQGKHNTLLHNDSYKTKSDSVHGIQPAINSSVNQPTLRKESTTQESKLTTYHVGIPETSAALLGTIFLFIVDPYGQIQTAKAVLDNCSQTCIITESCVKRLGYKPSPSNVEIVGIRNHSNKSSGSISLRLVSRFKDYSIPIHAQILPKITDKLPNEDLSDEIYNQFKHLALADIQFHKSHSIDLLLDVNFFSNILTEDSPNVIKGNPTALKTKFGWVIMGNFAGKVQVPITMACTSNLDSIEATLIKFWETEEIVPIERQDPDDQFCIQYFRDTYKRDENGRITVRLPFKDPDVKLANNRASVETQFLKLEERLIRKGCDVDYHQFMQEYIRLGHMQLATKTAEYLIPHHVVTKSTSSTTKTRVVFNASARDPCGTSLNDLLLRGPKLQRDITHILTSFRFHEIVITADMKMMFRQILLAKEDRGYQHIVYRPASDSQVLEYELNTITYGTKPASYLAIASIQQLAKEEGPKFPKAASALLEDTYVDDVVTGADSVSEALELKKQLIGLLATAGIELRKWASNRPELLEDLSEEYLETPLTFLENSAAIKVLGLAWTQADVFMYQIKQHNGPMTKRNILSYTAKIFDPLGFLTPVVFWFKYFLHNLWKCKLDWDVPLPRDLQRQFNKFLSSFGQIAQVKIPRRIPYLNTVINLIGFSDASQMGCGCVIYAQCQSKETGKISTHILTAKSKVVPLKKLTIPKMELTAMLLLAKLINHVLNSNICIHINDIYLFSDSEIALNWIKMPVQRLTPFVTNRVSQINERTKNFKWAYVNSKENPADIASRGATAAQLVDNDLWWNGPEFLLKEPKDWNLTIPIITEDELPELQTPKQTFVTIQKQFHPLYQFILNNSIFSKLIRKFGYLIRFGRHISNLGPTDRVLTVDDLNYATQMIVKVIQREHFADDIKLIEAGKPVSKKLLPLSPFLDEKKILRVGGRIQNSSLPFGTKHPIILPNDHFSEILCRFYHMDNFHSGFRVTQVLISQKYWILDGKRILKRVIYKCPICTRFQRRPKRPFMADLPPSRFSTVRAFYQVGTDFAGPFNITDNSLRKARVMKGYLCIFICMSTKAVHLEAVTELTTVAFLATLNRFISRRGLPHSIYSDNGTNYQGASNQLAEVQQFLEKHSDEILTALAMKQIRWIFNPPDAPNFGGLWEASVKSVKSLLYKHIGRATFSFEELSTLFCRIEAILNSRPLSFDVDDPQERDFLSPGHFLIGTSLLSVPEIPIPENRTLKGKWERVKQMSQAIWSKWHTEYLCTLQNRYKWNKPSENIELNQLVYMTDVNTSPLCWPLGRVIHVYPGPDQIVRVVKIKTAGGEFVRPVNKLILIKI